MSAYSTFEESMPLPRTPMYKRVYTENMYNHERQSGHHYRIVLMRWTMMILSDYYHDYTDISTGLSPRDLGSILNRGEAWNKLEIWFGGGWSRRLLLSQYDLYDHQAILTDDLAPIVRYPLISIFWIQF